MLFLLSTDYCVSETRLNGTCSKWKVDIDYFVDCRPTDLENISLSSSDSLTVQGQVLLDLNVIGESTILFCPDSNLTIDYKEGKEYVISHISSSIFFVQHSYPLLLNETRCTNGVYQPILPTQLIVKTLNIDFFIWPGSLIIPPNIQVSEMMEIIVHDLFRWYLPISINQDHLVIGQYIFEFISPISIHFWTQAGIQLSFKETPSSMVSFDYSGTYVFFDETWDQNLSYENISISGDNSMWFGLIDKDPINKTPITLQLPSCLALNI